IEEITVLKLQIEKLMDKFKDREDFRIIKEKYFNDKTNEEIGDMLNIDESTVRRRKNKIINDMSKILFPLSAESAPKVRLEISE
ncbi:sigma factor-like helix-turn-helix DNA-binding protein, partial [Fusobacterium sp.]|uniref:sigma factor-like helix-turn-helix DNA-binding protein n=1 Tax=Fusobacterium sp. TaxID=68766 RepID=UPI0025BD3A69